ncbi:MAG: phosphotransferase [Acidobacteriota bacterium]|nr:phosphotransferase [Acidobacteriota bacterium]
MFSARQNLKRFLAAQKRSVKIEPLTPDASTREYFRVDWNDATAIACVYPEPFLPKEQTYLDVTNLFLLGGLPVAKIFDYSGALGVIIQEDFGDTILRDVLDESESAERDELLNEAIRLIARIQAATDKAFEIDSIASRLKFDREKLGWELAFFKEHYFETYRKQTLSENDDAALTEEFSELAGELEQHARVLCHRDFHAANLMVDKENCLRIIDHQDARIGAASYDLVSLLLDRVLSAPDEDWLEAKIRFFLSERENLELEKISFEDFLYEFRLQTIQRCLKATGTFSYQSVNRGKTYFVQYIEPMLCIVLQACEQSKRFPNLQNTIKTELNK